MEQAFSRTEMLLGRAAMEKLASSRVAVFGIGGVGGYAKRWSEAASAPSTWWTAISSARPI